MFEGPQGNVELQAASKSAPRFPTRFRVYGTFASIILQADERTYELLSHGNLLTRFPSFDTQFSGYIMPKIISHTPSWLSRPSPGFQLFNTPKSAHSSTHHIRKDSDQTEFNGPNRNIARRGTEVFVVAGKHIRWSDLSILKAEHEELEATPSKKPKASAEEQKVVNEDGGPENGSYRVRETARRICIR